jgi:phage terminase Nu1 subunit (DNA packaging protein)
MTTTQEPYIDARQLAQTMGVSTRTIRRMTAAGMPSENWGLGNTRRYLASEAIAWARQTDNLRTIQPPGRRVNVDQAHPGR